ncbi:MAG: hypothetical protein CMM77_15065 [Rhodospirillaceae bacterium]|nr:hypothetical protein [Rhodospirillaceae bacterium]
MMPSAIRFWFGYFYIGQPGMGTVQHGLGPGPEAASNGDHRCEIIPFPVVDDDGAPPPPPPPPPPPAKASRRTWGRVRKNAEMIWSHPRTQGAFVVQRLVAITLAVTLASLFERICE